MKIAIYGGSFDPPHFGHEQIVKTALKQLDIDTLYIVLAWLNPFKKSFFAPPWLRLFWVKTLWENVQKVQICTYELENQRPTSTYETILHLFESLHVSKCYVIVGADNVSGLKKWANYEKLSQMVEFVVASRDNIKIPKNLKKLQINANISSSNLRQTLQQNFISDLIFKSVKQFYEGEKMQDSIQAIVSLLDSKKAENIQVFDMRGKDYLVDDVIIATTMNERHSNSLIDELNPVLKTLNEQCLHVDSSGEWAVLDLGNTLIHLMSGEYRSKYNIEAFLSDFEKLKEQN